MTDLGLQIQVLRHFGFLVSDKGYRCTESSPYRVRFESSTVFIEILFDGHRSYEINLVIGKIGSNNGGRRFSIDEILRFCKAPEAKRFSLIQVVSRETMTSFVAQLAEMLKKYGDDFVAGNEERFKELALQRKREVEKYALEYKLRTARANAAVAWHKKEYSAVIKILDPFRAILTASEIKKLEFAKKKI